MRHGPWRDLEFCAVSRLVLGVCPYVVEGRKAMHVCKIRVGPLIVATVVVLRCFIHDGSVLGFRGVSNEVFPCSCGSLEHQAAARCVEALIDHTDIK